MPRALAADGLPPLAEDAHRQHAAEGHRRVLERDPEGAGAAVVVARQLRLHLFELLRALAPRAVPARTAPWVTQPQQPRALRILIGLEQRVEPTRHQTAARAAVLRDTAACIAAAARRLECE